MNKKFKHLIFIVFGFIFFTMTFVLNVESGVSATENENFDLIKKISKDYTNKFCNSIAFGLSKESAMKFSIEENKKVFKKRKGINNIDKEILAENISISVVDNCGYPLNLSGEQGVLEFKNYFLSNAK